VSNTKKIVSFVLCVVVIMSFALPCFAQEKEHKPLIVDTIYETADVVIADIVATEAPYNADNSGKADSTAAIQKAIDDCAANGGGTVFLPAGKYRLTGNIYIRQFVTLRGDYQDPDVGKEYGTIIIADVESKDVMTPGLITVGASAGAVGLTVWYPNQDINNVKPYPFTFYVKGNEDYMLHTIKDCTLINSYRGIGASAECENGIYECHEMLTIENVKGTCLFEGLNSYNSADVDTIKTLYIDNKYWAQAGEEFNAPDEKAIDEYTRKNGCGFVIGDLEWPQFADVKISDMQYGMIFRKPMRYSYSGIFTDLYITDCDYGIYAPEDIIVHRGLSWGTGIVNGVIEGEKYAIYHPGNTAMLLTNVQIEGKTKGSNIRSYKTDTSSFAPEYNRTYNKVESFLYVVDADKSGKTDASSAVQEKLDEAAVTGGIVYLPAGLYRFDGPIKIPAGVELRGSSSVATRCQRDNSAGTLIISYYGYDKSSEPLVTLDGDNAGLNGIRIDYALNGPVDNSGKYAETSPVVYSSADDIYITNCYITLASCGIKLENVENAFIKKIVGCCYESMFDFENCSNVFVEGCLQNANTLPRNGFAKFDIPELSNRITEDKLFDYVFIPITRIHTDFIKLVSCKEVTVFNTFIYGGKTFLNSVDSDVLLINVGLDGSSKTEYGYILSGGEVNLINSMRSTSDGKSGYNFYTIENNTKFRSYNSQVVDLLYREHLVLENISKEDLLPGEKIYYSFSFFYKVQRYLGNLYVKTKQG